MRELPSLASLSIDGLTMANQEVKAEAVTECELLQTAWQRDGVQRFLPYVGPYWGRSEPWVAGRPPVPRWFDCPY